MIIYHHESNYMSFCSDCGSKNIQGILFCWKCGNDLKVDKAHIANTEFLVLKQPKTKQLQIVQGLNWFYFIVSFFLGMINIIIDEYRFSELFLIIFSGLLLIIIRGLNNYINIIRLIWGVISVFIFVFSFIDFVPISVLLILISGYVAYTLFFHKPTVSLFK